ncbi:hypothetical protein EMCG_01350 [[Emmonsia] crescens]|uniref:Uncharacterized protein n=1 Tax=[Emmonsia] crescens TaxID=73230 RepID=A0A0G2I4E3_9EURO|nr:hypothetical protein EMCG_01350 [Emmonsia crescens UAMH 3008]
MTRLLFLSTAFFTSVVNLSYRLPARRPFLRALLGVVFSNRHRRTVYLRQRPSPDGVCDAVCPPADLSTLQKWYAGFCSAGNPRLTQSSTTTASPTTSPNPESDPRAGTSPSVKYEAPPSWFSTHWKLVVVVIILAVGFTALALLLVFLNRRHGRKRANNQPPFTPGGSSRSGRGGASRNLVAAALGDDKWGPQQHLAHTRCQGPGSASSAASAAGTRKGTESGQFASVFEVVE